MVGRKIRERRLQLGLTQEELAEKLGYKHKSAINKIELGINDVNQSKLIKIANALECSPAEFIDVDIVPPNNDLPLKLHAYMDKISKLSPNQQENVFQYIDFLITKGEKE